MVWSYLASQYQITKDRHSMLHFAPERALKKRLNQLSNVAYVDVDLNPNMASVQADITALPFDTSYFDLILCSHVLAHIPEEEKALEELFRVLKAGGTALILTNISADRAHTESYVNVSESERARLFGDPTVQRVHGMDYLSLLQNKGFRTEVVKPGDWLSRKELKELSIPADELLLLAKKP
jgi:SAM-dependent methyltransferase